MNDDRVVALLRRECEAVGGQKEWAKQAGVSPQYVCDVLAGRKLAGDGILRGLGLVRVIDYRRAPAPPAA